MRTVTLKRLIDDGYGDRLCPSHDCICLHIHNEQPDATIPLCMNSKAQSGQFRICSGMIPHLQSLVWPTDINKLLIDNPRNFFAGS